MGVFVIFWAYGWKYCLHTVSESSQAILFVLGNSTRLL